MTPAAEHPRAPRVFTLPPGVPFLRALAAALAQGRLVEGFGHRPQDPLVLARATVFVPTRRAARVLRSEFVDLLGRGSAILPVIRPLGEIDDDAGFFEPSAPSALELLPPLGRVDALLELAHLILEWKAALPAAIAEAGGPLAAPASPADAVWLARALADLLDAMETEEVPWAALDGLDTEDHAAWWQLTAEFLRIATTYWPARLAERGRSAPAAHRNALLHAEAARIAAGGAGRGGPLIVAGSTGSLPATAALMRAVLADPMGAIVLPGLDTAMAPEHWQAIGVPVRPSPGPPWSGPPWSGPPWSGPPWPGSSNGMSPGAGASARPDPARLDAAVCNHPQYGLKRLLATLGIAREDVVASAVPPPALDARRRLVSLAMVPPEATADWADAAHRPDAATREAALAGVTLVEAANERQEAMAIAVAMRLALEDGARESGGVAGNGGADDRQADGGDGRGPLRGERQVALVTPDRALARRVAVELHRFGIAADDSGGMPLSATGAGTLARLVVEAALMPGDPVAVLALVKHPLARFGLMPEAIGPAAAALELLALRGGTGEADAARLSALVDARLAAARSERHPPRWYRRLDADAVAAARGLAASLEAALAPLSDRFVHRPAAAGSIGTRQTVARWVEATGHALEAAGRDGDGAMPLWADEAGAALARLFAEAMESGSPLAVDGAEWARMLPALMADAMVRPEGGSHPRVFIWGTLEARLQHVDTLVLGGLNEASWPGPVASDPFLSRAMKIAVGLEPPERRIGQAAHDFAMALGAPEVVVSRAARAGGAPTVASRWLQRLLALAGGPACEAMRARGDRLIAHGEALDAGPPEPIATRPEPRPPRARQPTSYSFSEVRTLRRDPYAIYARRILGLDPLTDLVRDPAASERGTLYHRILEDFVRTAPDPAAADALDRLRAIAARHFAEEGLPPHVAATWRPRFARVAELFVEWERDRAGEIVERRVEAAARMPVAGMALTLTGRADRIDLRSDGRADIIDYKTGQSPTRAQARALLDPQLALEAAALSAGAFAGIEARPVAGLCYVRLAADERLGVDDVARPPRGGEDTRDAAGLAADALAQLAGLVALLASGRRGFASRLIPASARDFGGEYDHLARVAEWSSAEADGGGEDG